MDLHVLGCPEHNLTISGKCLPVCVSVTKAGEQYVLLTFLFYNWLFTLFIAATDLFKDFVIYFHDGRFF